MYVYMYICIFVYLYVWLWQLYKHFALNAMKNTFSMQLIAPVHNVAYLPYYYCGMYIVATTRAMFIICCVVLCCVVLYCVVLLVTMLHLSCCCCCCYWASCFSFLTDDVTGLLCLPIYLKCNCFLTKLNA